MWIEKLGTYFLDVSKYILTGLVVASMGKDCDNKILIYVVGLLLSILCLIVGLILTNKKDKKDKDKKEKDDEDNNTNNNKEEN